MTLDVASPFLPFIIAVVACVYASVGHGGASGYLAVLSVTTLASKSVAISALLLNLVVASISFLAFQQAKRFSWKLTWPFLLGAAPFAFVGSQWKISDRTYFMLVAVVLLWAGARLLFSKIDAKSENMEFPPIPAGAAIGSGVGFLSGLVGVGGGIFLSPIIVLSKWADAKTTAATTAIFIVSNSAIGLLARSSKGFDLPPDAVWLVVGGASGALLGSWIGSQQMPVEWLRRLLGVVLLLAATKLLTNS